MTDIDWRTIEDWDRRYYLHNTASGRELNYAAVQRVDGNYIHLADGSKLLDFQSQLISDSLGIATLRHTTRSSTRWNATAMCFLVWVLICARGRPSCWSKTYLAVIQVGRAGFDS